MSCPRTQHNDPARARTRTSLRVSQGFCGTREHWQNIEGNKGTLANFWEQGNKIRKITVRKHSERVWEHGNIGQFWKGTREQGPPWETLLSIRSQSSALTTRPPRLPENCQGNLTECWEVTCDGLASRPGGVAILLVA